MSTAPAAAVPAPSARTSPNPGNSGAVATRADVVRLARTGGPWAFLPVALGALRNHPDDHEVRFLAAAAFARLALVTPARDHLALLPSELRADAGVSALTAAIVRLPDDRIAPATLAATCRGNLEALAGRGVDPIDLRGHLGAWERTAGDWEWFRAHDGNLVRRRGGSPASVNDRWLGLADLKGQIDAATLPHAAADAKGQIKPYILEGMDPPWLVERVLRETPAASDGYHARVTIVQEDPLELLDGLAQTDLRRWLSEPRVSVIVGPDAGGALSRRLLGSLDTQIAGPGLSLSTVRTPANPSVQQALQLAGRAQVIEQQQLLARVGALYADRDRAWWSRRYAAARPGAPSASSGGRPTLRDDRAIGGTAGVVGGVGGRGNHPELALGAPRGDRGLRVLVPTCRFSTYIKHASADLAAALRSMGCEARVLTEPDDHSHLSGVAYLRAVAEFEPDLVVLINYARANINGSIDGEPGAPGVIPANVPFVMWVQDAMPHQLDERVGRGMSELDFVAGNLREELFWRFGYPRARSLDVPIVASSAKFHCGPVSDALRARHTCEVAYVSHHAETPGAMHARKCAEAASTPGLTELLEALRPRVEAEAAVSTCDPLSLRLRNAVTDALRARGGASDDPRLIEQLMQLYAMPMADRVLRHQTLAWAAETSDSRGWRLHLYGRGWETHPTLARFARGELTHGEELRASYRCAAAHLQVSAHSIIHQRIMECALAGGMPIGRVTEEDLSTLEFAAAVAGARRAHAAERGPDVCGLRPISGTRHRHTGYAIADSPEAMSLACLRQRLGMRARPREEDQHDAFVWINSIHVERLLGIDPQGAPLVEAPRERMLTGLWPDPADALFIDRDGLEQVLVRAVDDPAWREHSSDALRRRVLDHCTHGSFARRLVDFIADGLGGDHSEPAP